MHRSISVQCLTEGLLYVFKGLEVERVDFMDLRSRNANVPEKLVEDGLFSQ
jgi:hypothetical protein